MWEQWKHKDKTDVFFNTCKLTLYELNLALLGVGVGGMPVVTNPDSLASRTRSVAVRL